MAFAASAVGRIRPGGNVLNGCFYDGTTYAGGVDYTQQDSPQLSLTDLVGIGTTTVTSVTAGFTANMVGNALNLTTASGGTVGFYFIASYTNATTVVLDRSPGTGTGWTCRVGGAWGGSTVHPFTLADNNNATGNKPIAGNTIYVRGGGTNAPSSPDYNTTTAFNNTPVAGDTTSGMIRWIGENGRPRADFNQRIWSSTSYWYLENFDLRITANTSASSGAITLQQGYLKNVSLNTNNLSSCRGINVQSGTVLENVEVWSGTTSPTANSNSTGVLVGGARGIKILGCKIHHMGDVGIDAAGNNGVTSAIGNWVYGNKGNGINVSNGDGNNNEMVYGNTIDGNGGDGINVLNLVSAMTCVIAGNIVSNNVGSGKFGINVAAGSAAAVAAGRKMIDYNFFYNNATNRSTNLAAGPNDATLSADPYTSAAGYDFSLNTTSGGGAAVRAAGFPPVIGTYPATGFTRAAWPDGGAVQHADPAGGSGGVTFLSGF